MSVTRKQLEASVKQNEIGKTITNSLILCHIEQAAESTSHQRKYRMFKNHAEATK